jgi:hypothetical protein
MATRSTHEATVVSAINAGSTRSTHEALLASVKTGVGKTRSTHEALLISVTAPVVGINYPLTPPAIAGIGPQDFTMTEDNVVGETESPFTLSQQVQPWPGQRFKIEANLPPLVMSEAEQWIAFLGSLFGKLGTFLMGDYNRPAPQGSFAGSPVVNGSNINGLNQLNLRGGTASITNWAVAGDYVQVTAPGFPQRIYKVLQNASTDGSGDVTLQIFPNLRETLADGTAIVTANCAGTFRLVENSFSWKVDRNKIYLISFKAKEAT